MKFAQFVLLVGVASARNLPNVASARNLPNVSSGRTRSGNTYDCTNGNCLPQNAECTIDDHCETGLCCGIA